MANFPAIVNEAWSSTTSDGTSHTVNLPTGATGDLLIVFVAFDGDVTITWPGGYTVLQADTNDGDAAITTEVRYRVTDGSEGASISLTTGASEKMSAMALRFTNYTGTPEAGTAAITATGLPNASPNPPSLSPSWGAADTLWLVWIGMDGAVNVNTGSARRNELISTNGSGGAATDIQHAFSAIHVNAASRDPATFTITASDQWVANTFAIQGAAPSGGSGGQRIFGG